jgi:hypothetical protein
VWRPNKAQWWIIGIAMVVVTTFTFEIRTVLAISLVTCVFIWRFSRR